MMFKILSGLGLAIALWFPQHADASCVATGTTDGEPARIEFLAWDPGTFDPDAYTVGQVITSQNRTQGSAANGGSGAGFQCTDVIWAIDRRGTTSATYQVLNGRNVYSTSVPGIGIAGRYTNCAPSSNTWPTRESRSGNYTGSTWTSGCNIQVELIKTGPVSPGSLGGEFGAAFIQESKVMTYVFNGTIPIKPTVPTCTPTVSDKVLDMGNVDAGSVTDDGYSDAVPFNMDVVCSGGLPVAKTAQMAATFTDATNPINATDKLTLTPASTASGVKVQILSGGVPVVFGAEPADGLDKANSVALGTVKNGTYTYPLSARYVQTGAVTAGSANAIATFTYTYH